MPLSVSLNAELDSRALESGNLSFTYVDPVSVSSLSPALGPTFGGTAVTVRGAGFATHGTVQCRFGSHPPVNASYATGETSSPARSLTDTALVTRHAVPLTDFVCYSPPHALGAEGHVRHVVGEGHVIGNGHVVGEGHEGGDVVPFRVSMTGDAAEFTEYGAGFFYHHPCRGHGDVGSYATEYGDPANDARAAVTRYLAQPARPDALRRGRVGAARGGGDSRGDPPHGQRHGHARRVGAARLRGVHVLPPARGGRPRVGRRDRRDHARPRGGRPMTRDAMDAEVAMG